MTYSIRPSPASAPVKASRNRWTAAGKPHSPISFALEKQSPRLIGNTPLATNPPFHCSPPSFRFKNYAPVFSLGFFLRKDFAES
jgi:hypothetical protein